MIIKRMTSPFPNPFWCYCPVPTAECTVSSELNRTRCLFKFLLEAGWSQNLTSMLPSLNASLLPSSESMGSLGDALGFCLLMVIPELPSCLLGDVLSFIMQKQRADRKFFLKFSFMKAYTIGLQIELKNPMIWTIAKIILIVTSSYSFSKLPGEKREMLKAQNVINAYYVASLNTVWY